MVTKQLDVASALYARDAVAKVRSLLPSLLRYFSCITSFISHYKSQYTVHELHAYIYK